MSDLFHESLPEEDIAEVFRLMHRADWHTYQILTKRSARLLELAPRLRATFGELKHVWLGVSVEDRKALARIDDLRRTPCAVRFLSIEPLLEDLGRINLEGISWVIVGGESGPGARAMDPCWPRSIRDQCQAAGIPFFFKQWGAWAPREFAGMRDMVRVGKRAAGRLLDGREWNEFPNLVNYSCPKSEKRQF